MGKIKHKKHSFHTSAPKAITADLTLPSPKVIGSEANVFGQESDWSLPQQNASILAIPRNVFQNVSISPDMLKQTLVHASPVPQEKKKRSRRKRTGVSDRVLEPVVKEFKEVLMAQKKLKKKMRFPISAVYQASKEISRKKMLEQKKRSNVLAYMDPLISALPTLDSLEEKPSTEKHKPRVSKRRKIQDKEMMDDIKAYQEMLKNPAFQLNPLETVSTNLNLKMDSEQG